MIGPTEEQRANRYRAEARKADECGTEGYGAEVERLSLADRAEVERSGLETEAEERSAGTGPLG